MVSINNVFEKYTPITEMFSYLKTLIFENNMDRLLTLGG